MAMIRSFGVALAVIILMDVVVTNSAAGFTQLCNSQTIASGDTYLNGVKVLLSLLEVNHGQMQELAGTKEDLGSADGISTCDNAPNNDYCVSCLTGIANNIFQLCGYVVGAQVTSIDPNCYLRYENYIFS